jgi:hypothetical protein
MTSDAEKVFVPGFDAAYRKIALCMRATSKPDILLLKSL